MAWNDETLKLKGGPVRRAIDLAPIEQQLDDSAQSYAETAADGGARLRSAVASSSGAGRSTQFEPAEFAMNAQTGEIALPNGEVVKATAPIIMQLATLKSRDGAAIPRMSSSTMAELQKRGFRPASQQYLVDTVKKIPTQSDFIGEAVANGKTTLGLAAAAIDSLFGSDDPNNAWTHAQQDHENEQTIGQLKASRGRWYSGWDEFINGLGQTAGNIGGNVVGALPVAAAGAAAGAASGAGVGAVPGGLLGAGLAVSGGASAYGEQATDFYTNAMSAMAEMSPAELEQNSKLYREVVRANPGISEDEAKREVAIQGARIAGGTAGMLGAAEAIVGAKLAGNFLGRIGLSKTLLGPALQAVEKRAGLAAGAVRVAGRGALGAAGAGAEEMGESMLGQSAGAAYTGIGSDDPRDYANWDEGIAAAQGGALFGLFGGRAHGAGSPALSFDMDPTETARTSDIGQALAVNPDVNQPWNQQRQLTVEQDMIPAQMRRELGQRQMAAATPGPPPSQRDQIQAQIENVLAERFGPQWADNIDLVASRPEGRQLVGQLMAIEQDRRAELEDPAYQRGYGQGPVPAGQPSLRGPAFGDQQLQLDGNPPTQAPGAAPAPAPMQANPAQQALPGMEYGPQDFQPEQQGTPPPLNLAERRAAQQLRQQEMTRLSEQNPQALPQSASRGLEQQIFELEDQREQLEQAIAQRPPRDPRKKFLRQSLEDVNAQLAQLEDQWTQARETEGPQGVAPANRVDSPEPIAAPQELAPSGDRPMGVSPPALENPEPMSPEEAASRAQTQAERGATPEQVQQAAAQSEQGVAASTPEPAEDLAAQVQALADPASERDAVFVVEGQDAPAAPKGVVVVKRPGVGTLLTTNKAKAAEFRTKKLTDKVMQRLLGYSQDKAAVLAAGEEPAVVQAQTPTGAVAAEQVATRKGVPAARAAVAKQAPKGAKVIETSVAAAQARRAAKATQTPPKTAAAVATSKERATKPKKPVRKTKADDDKTRDERALSQPGAPRQAAAPAATSDTLQRAANRQPDSVTFRGKKIDLPARMITQTGHQGSSIDLRTNALDREAARRVGAALQTGTLSTADRAKAEGYLRDYKQLKAMFDAAVAAGEERLKPVIESAGAEFTREAERKQLELEHTANPGSKRELPRTSPLAYLPLVPQESRGFLQALRREAKAELAHYAPSRSVARSMISAIDGRWDSALEDERRGRQVLQVFANMDDATLEQVLASTHSRIQDSTVAKQVMRGATEVSHAMRRMEQDLQGSSQGYSLPEFAEHGIEGVDQNKQPHATEHGPIPEGVKGVVNEWVSQFEKGGNKFAAPVHVMSLSDAIKLYPAAFAGKGVPNGKYLRLSDDKGNVTGHVLALDWNRFKSKEAATEVLAHEFGHAVTTELYARASPSTRLQIDKAYSNWLRAQEGRSVDDVLRDQMPGIERTAYAGGATNRAYATSFWEWAARNAALYIVDPNRPHLSAVEKFFKAIADVMRKVYQSVTGGKIDATWEGMLDRWVDGSLELGRMPKMEPAAFNHDAEFADDREPRQEGTVRAIARAGTEALAPLRDIFSGKTTVEDVREQADRLAKTKPAQLANKAGLSLMTLRQIERRYRDTPVGRALSGWVRNQQLKAKTANAVMEEGSKWVEQALQLQPRVREAMEKVMYQATRFGIHPDQPFNAKDNAHLTTDSDYVTAVNERRYAGLSALYNKAVAADPRVAKIYAGLRDSISEVHNKTLAKQLEVVQNSDFSEPVKEQITQRIKNAQREMRQGPYFPLMRFGDWIVKVQLPAHMVGQEGKTNGEYFDSKAAAREEVRNQRALNPGAQVTIEKVPDEAGKYLVRVYQRGVYYFNSQAEAEAARGDIEKEVRENYDAMGVSYDDAQAQMEPTDDGDGAGAQQDVISQPFAAVSDYESTKRGSPEFINEVRSLQKEGKLDPEVAATLERLAVEALPENNYRQSLLPRQNVFGASQNMLRSYANRFQGAAHHYAAVEHGQQVNKNWSEIRKARESYAPAGDLYNSLLANQNLLAERMKDTVGNRVANIITNASSLYSLGFSPAYVMTNALQPWTVAAPVMAGLSTPGGKSVGMVKAAKYLKDAYSGAMPFFTKRGLSDFINETKALAGQKGTAAGLQETAKDIITKFGKTPEEQRMLESLLERGTLDFGWLNSLDDAMRASKASQKWANLQRLGMAFPQQVEAMNRVTTALAAYRLAKDERLTDGSEASLQEFADDMVADTQLDYSRMNRPLAFNKQGFNIILQFKLYMQGMYMLFARNAAMALRGKTAEERAQGRKTIAYLLASHASAAGASGLGPAVGMAKLGLMAFAGMSGGEDDWKSGDQLLHEMLQDLLGESAGTVAEKGLPALLGLDMSDRIGLPVPYDARFAGTRPEDSTGTTIDKLLLYSLGAPYSNFKRIVAGGTAAAQGDFGNAINGLPSAARAMMRSAKWAKEGIVNQNGDTFIPREDLSWGDLGANALGLPTLKTSEAYRERSETKQTTAKIMERRKELLQASRTGEDVREEIAAFNAQVPRPFQITGKQESASAKSKAARERGDTSKQEAAVARMLGR